MDEKVNNGKRKFWLPFFILVLFLINLVNVNKITKFVFRTKFQISNF